MTDDQHQEEDTRLEYDKEDVRSLIIYRGFDPATRVLIIETAAQMATIHIKLVLESVKDKFIGFSGLNDVRFRRQVLPGDELIIASQVSKMRSRSFSYRTQGFVGKSLAFEGEVVGILI